MAEVEYRASELGGCIKAQIAKRMGYVPAEYPEDTQRLFKEGNLHEKAVLDDLPGLYGFQQEVRLPITEKIDVVGHVDALEAMHHRVVEVKSMSARSYEEFLASRLKMGGLMERYNWQTSCYMAATGKMVRLIVKNRNTGEMTEATLVTPVYTIAEIRARVLMIETAARKGELPIECDPVQFPCPFYYLHEETPVELLGPVEEHAFDAAAESYCDAMDAAKRAKKVSEDARGLVEKMVKGGGKVQTARFYATPYTQKRKRVNWERVTEMTGVRKEDFEEEDVSEMVRIGRRDG